MALVAYGFEDTDEEDDQLDTNNFGNLSNAGQVILKNVPQQNKTELFSSLPAPKSVNTEAIQGENDKFLNKTAQPDNGIIKKRSAIKISVPALDHYNSDEEDAPKKKILKSTCSSKAVGLFAVLPAPKQEKGKSSAFIPYSVAKKVAKEEDAYKKTEPYIQVTTNNKGYTNVNDTHFFSSIFSDESNSAVKQSNIRVESDRPVKEADIRCNKYFSDIVQAGNIMRSEQNAEMVVPSEEILMKEAYSELVGRSRKAKGRYERPQQPDVVDINAADIMAEPREWMTKCLMEEQSAAGSVRKGDEPSLQHRRKHQITYLAYQAKLNEQELKNQWALNRMSRKQTQAKYGF